MENTIPPLTGHVVVVNCNEKVAAIVEELQTGSNGEPLDVVLLVHDRELWEAHPHWRPEGGGGAGFYTLYGSAHDMELLKQASIRHARAAIILADPTQGVLTDARSTLAAVAIERENPQVHTVEELILSINRDHLARMNVDEVVCLGEISEKLIAQSCISREVKNVFQELLTTRSGTTQIFLPEIPLSLHQKTYREIARECIEKGTPFIPLGYIINTPIPRTSGPRKGIAAKSVCINPRRSAKDIPLTGHSQLAVMAYDPPGDLGRWLD